MRGCKNIYMYFAVTSYDRSRIHVHDCEAIDRVDKHTELLF